MRPSYWPIGGQPHRTEPFTWIVKGKIAASWWPDIDVLERYSKEGIRTIINCCEFDNRNDFGDRFQYYHINIPDFGVPNEAQIKIFLDITDKHISKNEPIVVHCVAGCGRTGQMIVAWAAYNGIIPNGMDPVQWIRNIRSCSLETSEQANFARKIAEKLIKTK